MREGEKTCNSEWIVSVYRITTMIRVDNLETVGPRVANWFDVV